MGEEEVAAVVCARLIFSGDDALRVFRHDAETRPSVVGLRALFFGAGDFRLQVVPVPLPPPRAVRIDRLIPLF